MLKNFTRNENGYGSIIAIFFALVFFK